MSLITFDDKVDSISNPAPRVNKVIADDINQLKQGVDYFYNLDGWVRYQDTGDSEGSPQVLTASTDNVITIVDADPIDDEKPIDLGANQLWTGNKITPIRRGDVYLIRFDFLADIDNVSGYFDYKIDIDGSIGVIFNKSFTFPKGSGVTHGFSFTEMIYTLDTFILNGGNIVINPSHTMNIWNKSITIQRVYKGKS